MDEDVNTPVEKPTDQLMDILLVMDKEEKVIRAVKGLDANNQLETIPVTDEYNNQFLRVDKNANLFENFFSNFFRQLKDPTRFRFFKVREDKLKETVQEIQKNIDTLTPAGEKLLSSYEVRPQNQESMKPTEDNKPENHYRFSPEAINWDSLKNLGINKEQLEKANALEPMLKGYKSPNVFPISVNLGDAIVKFDARLSFQQKESGEIVLAMHGLRKEPTLDKPFFGHTFTQEDKDNLLNTGNMGRLAETKNHKTGETSLCYISLDRITNEIVSVRASSVRPPEEIKGVKLNEEQKMQLQEGKSVYLDSMISKNGKEFSANVQVNAEKRGIEFIFPEQKQARQIDQQQNKNSEEKTLFIPYKLAGVHINKQQQDELRAGGIIHLTGMVDKKGQEFNAFVQINKDTGRPFFPKLSPEDVAKVIPANESKTQVAVNNEGKTNEATKNIKEPLKKGQTEPTEKQVTKQQENVPTQKSKGRKL